jgi:hypothetical protein
LRGLKEEGLFRVILIHHPPGGTEDIFRRLTDARRIKRAVLRAGAELILHGHNHKSERTTMLGLDGPVAVVGVPSASARPDDTKFPGSYNIYRIDGEPGHWRCEMVTRGYARGETVIAERQRVMLIDPDAPRTAAHPGLSI